MRPARSYHRQLCHSIRAAACLVAAGCGATDPPPEPPALTASIALVSGDGQEHVAGDQWLPFTVRVFDAQGPRPGQTVTFTGAIEGGTWYQLGEATSGPDGIAAFRWQPEYRAGTWFLRAAISDRDTVRFAVRVSHGPPHSFGTCCVFQEYAPLGGAVAYPMYVQARDKAFNTIQGLKVTFRLVSGGGTIADSVQITDHEGIARLGHWTLGPSEPAQTVQATLEGGLTATQTMWGAPHGIAIVAGDSQRANVGTTLKRPLVVRLFGPGGAPLGAGFPVGFRSMTSIEISSNGPTDSTGTATSGRVQLSPYPGTTTVTAYSWNQEVNFTLWHSIPTPKQLIPLTGNGGAAFAGNLLGAQPRFRLIDSVGDPVSGHHPLTFTASHGGTVLGQAYTDSEGIGGIYAWRLGSTLGEQTLVASYDGAELPGKFTAAAVAAPASSRFNIDVRFRDTLLADSARQVITEAAKQWAAAIVGDVPDVPLDLPADPDDCYPALKETVDDLVIFVSVVKGDGPGGALAGATPCLVRGSTFLPIVSLILIDEADLEYLGKFRMGRVAVHEIGHTLGFGTLWEALNLFRPPPSEEDYLGSGASAAFSELISPQFWVPIERGGGPGTRYSHWANAFPDLMVGYLFTANVLSAITLGAMRDLGYTVDDRFAEPFPASAFRLGPIRNERYPEWVPRIPLRTVDARGRVTRRYDLP